MKKRFTQNFISIVPGMSQPKRNTSSHLILHPIRACVNNYFLIIQTFSLINSFWPNYLSEGAISPHKKTPISCYRNQCFLYGLCAARLFWGLAHVAFALVVLVELRKSLFKLIAASALEQQLLGKTVIFRRQQLAVRILFGKFPDFFYCPSFVHIITPLYFIGRQRLFSDPFVIAKAAMFLSSLL